MKSPIRRMCIAPPVCHRKTLLLNFSLLPICRVRRGRMGCVASAKKSSSPSAQDSIQLEPEPEDTCFTALSDDCRSVSRCPAASWRCCFSQCLSHCCYLALCRWALLILTLLSHLLPPTLLFLSLLLTRLLLLFTPPLTLLVLTLISLILPPAVLLLTQLFLDAAAPHIRIRLWHTCRSITVNSGYLSILAAAYVCACK